MEILIINGPNLNLLGKREPEVYGNESFEEILDWLRSLFPMLKVSHFQSNHEGAIIDRIQLCLEDETDGLIINAGAYSHYSYAIRDALAMLQKPKVEVHLSHIYKREAFRHASVLSAVCDGLITGFGKESYRLALEWLKSHQSD